VISKGELILVEEKTALMEKLGKKELTMQLQAPLAEIPAKLAKYKMQLGKDGTELSYSFDSHDESSGIPQLLKALDDAGIALKDLATTQSSLEDIFVSLVSTRA
jgi:ABC-2 type transport system ATP-binding protein